MVKAIVKRDEYKSFRSYSSKSPKRKKNQSSYKHFPSIAEKSKDQTSFSKDFELDDLPRNDKSIHKPTGVYAVYKKATEAVRDGLATLLPKGFRLKCLDDYKRGANMIVQRSIEISNSKGKDTHLVMVEQSVFDSLNLSIRLREQQAQKHGDCCEGHQYIIQVLKYCREVLKFNNEVVESARVIPNEDGSQRKKAKSSKKGKHIKNPPCRSPLKVLQDNPDTPLKTKDTNQEDGLKHNVSLVQEKTYRVTNSVQDAQQTNVSNNNECDATGEDAEGAKDAKEITYDSIAQHIRQLHQQLKQLQIPKSDTNSMPQSPESILLAADVDLVTADDRFQCIAFLETMDELMGKVQDQFDDVKRTCLEDFDSNEPIYRLMEASIATNIYVAEVKSTWAELTLEHGHIRHFFDVVAIVFVLPTLSAAKYEDVFATNTKDQPHIVTNLIGDLVEACFKSDGMDIDEALMGFRNSVPIPDGNWEKESLMEEAQVMLNDVYEILTEQGSHKIRMSFLSHYKHIGGKRCILNTAKVTQQVFQYMAAAENVFEVCPEAAKAGQKTFQFTFHEDKNPVRGIRCELDQLLATEIIPQMISGSYDKHFQATKNAGPLNRICTLLSDMDEYEREFMGDSVPVHMTFALHAILTSILSMQGNGSVERLATKAKSYVCDYLDGLDQSRKNFHTKVPEGATLRMALKAFSPELNNIPNSDLPYAYWNPVVAGSLCTLVVYTGINVSVKFLRFGFYSGVHLYNALRDSGVLEDELPSFEIISNIFAKSTSIAIPDRRPKRGDYCKTYLHGRGYSLRDVLYIIDSMKRSFGIQTNHSRFVNDRSKTIRRDAKHARGLRSSDHSHGFAALFAANALTSDNLSHEISNAHPNSYTIGCDVYVAQACRAVRADLALYGGNYPDFIKMATEIGGCLTDIVQQLGFDEETDYALSILAQLDFQSHCPKESTMAFHAAKIMQKRFDCPPSVKYAINPKVNSARG